MESEDFERNLHGGMLLDENAYKCNRAGLYKILEQVCNGEVFRELICPVQEGGAGTPGEIALGQHADKFGQLQLGLLFSDRIGRDCTAWPATPWVLEEGQLVATFVTAKHSAQNIVGDEARLIMCYDAREKEKIRSFSILVDLLEDQKDLSPNSQFLRSATSGETLPASANPDVAFLKVTRHNLPDIDNFLTPGNTSLEDIRGQLVCTAGFPGPLDWEEAAYTLVTNEDYAAKLDSLREREKTAPDPSGRSPEEIMPRKAFILEPGEARKRVKKMADAQVYHHNEVSIGPGEVLNASYSTLDYSCSASSQMSGGPVVQLSNPLLVEAVHLRRGEGWWTLWNTGMSVHHGAFLTGYVKHVLPRLTRAPKGAYKEGQLQALHGYLARHQQVLEHYDLWDIAEIFMSQQPLWQNF